MKVQMIECRRLALLCAVMHRRRCAEKARVVARRGEAQNRAGHHILRPEITKLLAVDDTCDSIRFA